MSDKNVEIMKRIIEAKKEKSTKQGFDLRPEGKNVLEKKASTRSKRR